MQAIKCQRCGIEINTYSPMRKWCFECRKVMSLVQVKERKTKKKLNKP